MIFDVMIRKKTLNSKGKEVYDVFRCSSWELSNKLRQVQNNGDYIFSVIPLFKKHNSLNTEEE